MLDADLGRYSSVVRTWKQRYENSIDEALGDAVFDGLRANAERAHLRELRAAGTLPDWLGPALWERGTRESH